MAVIHVPFVAGMLDQDTIEAVVTSGISWRLHELDRGDESAYGRLWRQLWALAETVVICEHDVVPTHAQLRDIVDCPQPWCSYNYDDGLYPIGPMFGLAKFSGALMAEHPYAAEVATIIGKRRDTECEWWRVDSMVARDLMIRRVPWHGHVPAVHHSHHGLPSGPA